MDVFVFQGSLTGVPEQSPCNGGGLRDEDVFSSSRHARRGSNCALHTPAGAEPAVLMASVIHRSWTQI